MGTSVRMAGGSLADLSRGVDAGSGPLPSRSPNLSFFRGCVEYLYTTLIVVAAIVPAADSLVQKEIEQGRRR
jgi:hypothetical protein